MEQKVEQYLQDTILPELEKGRPDWDMPHTESVVRFIKAIITNDPDLTEVEDVLIIAAYAHDWGYAGLFEHGMPLAYNKMINAKEAHMNIGAQKTEQLLRSDLFNYLSKAQKDRIIHLVRVHDKLDGTLTDLDELSLLEADTLGGLQTSMTGSTLTKEEKTRWLNLTRKKRLPLFVHEWPRQQFEEMFTINKNTLGIE